MMHSKQFMLNNSLIFYGNKLKNEDKSRININEIYNNIGTDHKKNTLNLNLQTKNSKLNIFLFQRNQM